jgi:hypothetical protein
MEQTGTQPAYMAALEGLSERGYQLVNEVKECGRRVGQRDEEMRHEGGKVARRMEEELRQLKQEHTAALRAIADHVVSSFSLSGEAPVRKTLVPIFFLYI